MVQSLLYYASTQSWFPTDKGAALPGISALLTFILIVIALYVRGSSLPTRGELIEQRLPAVPRPERLASPAVLCAVVGVVALVVLPYDYRNALIISMAAMTICLSYVVITGFIGQVSLMQVALAGASGFVVSHLFKDADIGFPLAAIAGIVAATVLGFVAGASALRVRGVSLAVVTLAAAVAIEQFGFANSTWGGGGHRLAGARARSWPASTSGRGPRSAASTATCRARSSASSCSRRHRCWACSSPTCAAAAWASACSPCAPTSAPPPRRASTCATRSSPPTRSRRSSPASAGRSTRYSLGSVSAERFGILIALGFVAFAYVGGITMVSGAVFGGLIATSGLIPHIFEAELGISGTWTLLVAGVTLILNLILFPDGVAGSRYQKKKQAAAAKAGAAAGASVPSASAMAGSGERAMTAALSAQGVSVSFGGVHALVDVELEVPEGSLVGLIGPNGAGKTTFIDAITGFVRSRGPRAAHGRELSRLTPHERARGGLARTWQASELFDDLTVGENLAVATAARRAGPRSARSCGRPRRRRRGARRARARRPRGRRDKLPDELSQGQRKLVGVARALAAAPRVVCLDEPGRRPGRRRERGARPPAARGRRRRHGGPARRPRHGARARRLRPGRRARVRQGDRRRHARGGAPRPARGRGLPRRRRRAPRGRRRSTCEAG